MTGMEVALILLLLRATSSSSVTHNSSNIPATEGCEVAIPAHTVTSKLLQCSNRLKLRNVAKIHYINIRALIQAEQCFTDINKKCAFSWDIEKKAWMKRYDTYV